MPLINVSKSSDLLFHRFIFTRMRGNACTAGIFQTSQVQEGGDPAALKFIEKDLGALVDHKVSVCGCAWVRGS